MKSQDNLKEIKVLKSTELSDEMWEQIVSGYKICFNKDHNPKELKNSFNRTITGFTLHALKFNEFGRIIAHNYFQPRPYIINDKKYILALSGGTYVLPEHRKDAFILYDLYKQLIKASKDLGWVAQLSIPNRNSFSFLKTIVRAQHIGNLNYYILPLNVTKILKKRNLQLINFISRNLFSLYALLNNKISQIINTKEVIKPVRIERSNEFINARLPETEYKKWENGSLKGYYLITDEEGILTAYILDFVENSIKSIRALSGLVSHIINEEKIDAILYIGTLNLKQSLLFKVPEKYIPQQFPVIVNIFDKSNKEIFEALSSIKNIDYSLINFDVR